VLEIDEVIDPADTQALDHVGAAIGAEAGAAHWTQAPVYRCV